MSDNNTKPLLSVIGGTGDLGTGLIYRWVKAGYPVIIGSRTADKAEEARAAMLARIPDADIQAMQNEDAAKAGEIVVTTVPFSHQESTLNSIKAHVQGKIVVDTTVSLVPPRVARVQLPPEGSAGQIAQEILGEDVHVVSAFQNVAADHANSDMDLDCDILVCGNKKEARAKVVELANNAGFRGLHAGMINNAAASEALTSVLININKQYDCHAGIRITGIDGDH